MFIYINDTQITSSNPEKLDWAQTKIAKHFEIKNIEDSGHYLNIKIDQTEEEIKLSQSLYIRELLRDFKIEDCNLIQTFMNLGFDGKIDFSKDPNYTNKFTKQAYQSDVGSVQFLASQT